MNATSNSNPSPPDENQPEETATPKSSAQPRGCVLQALCSALSEGARQAKAAAESAIPKVNAALASATYGLGYGLSFATVFSYTIARELAPEVLKAGCRAGAGAGRKTAENLASRTQRDAEAAAMPPGTEEPGSSTEPGVA